MNVRLATILMLAVSFQLSACGGGGGSATATTSTASAAHAAGIATTGSISAVTAK
jgi:hypothetical protein